VTAPARAASATPAPSDATAPGRCAVCGAPDPLDLVVCPRCAAGTESVADTLVVVRGDERAYARVPAAFAPAVVERLAQERRPAQAVQARRAFAAVPARTKLLIFTVVAAGIAAGARGSPALGLLAPVVAMSLAIAAERAILRPRLGPAVAAGEAKVGAGELPERTRRQVVDTLAALPPGEARDLLATVVRRARSLVGSLGAQPDDPRVARDVLDLVSACCQIALEYERIDATLRTPGGVVPSAGDEGASLRERARAARELLAKRLRDAAGAVGELYAQQVERGGTAAERVAELASELTAEASARRYAAGEIDRLLGA
jgi:hypothetical protein